MKSCKGEKIKILFFGRKKCNASDLIIKKLKKYNYEVTCVKSRIRNEKLSEDILQWKGDYIFSFRNLLILPFSLLRRAKFYSINFHPAPPEYPGSGCVNFALYDEVKEYGVTAHIMNKKIDNGKIIEVRRFPINTSDNLKEVLSVTHNQLFKLCMDFIDAIYLNGNSVIKKKIINSKHEKWKEKAKTIKELESLQTISTNISKKELKRIIRATYLRNFPPKIKIHGFNFYLHLDE